MLDNREELLNQIHAGEDGRAEFKEVRFGRRGVIAPNPEDLAAEMIAFANADGGVAYLGVHDSGAVRGIPPDRIDAAER